MGKPNRGWENYSLKASMNSTKNYYDNIKILLTEEFIT